MNWSTLTVRDFLAWKFPGRDIDAWGRLVDAKIQRWLTGFQRVAAAVCKAAIALHEMPPAPGYEPLLIERGQHPLVARMLSYTLIGACKEETARTNMQGKVVDAIRFLAKPGRTERAVARKAAVLLGARDTVCDLKAFDAVGISVFNFEASLEAAARGDQAGCRRVMDMAAALMPRLYARRGRKVSAASLAHEILLSDMPDMTGQRGYTFDAYQNDFTDPLTRATRLAFGDPDFDPRPARRRAKNTRPI